MIVETDDFWPMSLVPPFFFVALVVMSGMGLMVVLCFRRFSSRFKNGTLLLSFAPLEASPPVILKWSSLPSVHASKRPVTPLPLSFC